MPAFLTYTGRSFAKGPSSPPSFRIGTISITNVIIITSVISITSGDIDEGSEEGKGMDSKGKGCVGKGSGKGGSCCLRCYGSLHPRPPT